MRAGGRYPRAEGDLCAYPSGLFRVTLEVAETGDLEACLALRFAVFVDEQGVPEEEERDALDDRAVHLLAVRDGVPVGCARIVFDGDSAKIGRVCVLRDARRTGVGVALMRVALDSAKARGARRAKLGAQLHALGFYEALGFAAYGDEFQDGGMPHRMMVRDLSQTRL
jgi:predicted GNAT family N-acyltransferase